MSHSITETCGTPGDPLVTIILPTYNRASWLPLAIDSCLSQTLQNIELIVVDDGSTDHTQQVAQQYARQDGRVRYRYQQNSKLPAALNTGHRAARGTYLTWTSDDNYYEPEALATMVDYLQRHPDVGLVYCNQKLIDRTGRIIEVRSLPGPERLWEGSCIGACFLYRREVYLAVGEYDTDAFLAEDYDYWLRISRRFRISHLIQVSPYRATCHENSLTHRCRAAIDWQCARVRAKNAATRWSAWRYLAQGYLELSYSQRCQAQWRQAIGCSARSVLYWPWTLAHYRAFAAALLRRVPSQSAS